MKPNARAASSSSPASVSGLAKTSSSHASASGLWGAFFKRQAGPAPACAAAAELEIMTAEDETIEILVLGGAPKTGNHATEEFRAQLLGCHALLQLREAMASSNRSCELDSGALIFVSPHLYHRTLAWANSLAVRRWMIVVEAKFVHIIESELKKSPFKKRAKIRRRLMPLRSDETRPYLRCCWPWLPALVFFAGGLQCRASTAAPDEEDPSREG